MKLPTGKIDVDSDFAKEIGFTSDNFESFSYLWGNAKLKTVWVSLVVSKNKGAFKTMIEEIEKRGLFFCIPTPFKRM